MRISNQPWTQVTGEQLEIEFTESVTVRLDSFAPPRIVVIPNHNINAIEILAVEGEPNNS